VVGASVHSPQVTRQLANKSAYMGRRISVELESHRPYRSCSSAQVFIVSSQTTGEPVGENVGVNVGFIVDD